MENSGPKDPGRQDLDTLAKHFFNKIDTKLEKGIENRNKLLLLQLANIDRFIDLGVFAIKLVVPLLLGLIGIKQSFLLINKYPLIVILLLIVIASVISIYYLLKNRTLIIKVAEERYNEENNLKWNNLKSELELLFKTNKSSCL